MYALHEPGVHVPETSIPFSLGFIVLVLAVTTVSSLGTSRKQQEEANSEAAPQKAEQPRSDHVG